MKMNQVAVQLYSVRDHLKTLDDLKSSIHRVREIGYEVVEVAGTGSVAAAELARLFAAEGLRCCSTHEPGDQILGNTKAVAERLATLGCSDVAYPFPAGVALGTVDEVRSFSERLNTAGRALSEAGIRLSYHNHNIEFRKVGGRTILEIILAETDPKYVAAELDTYWTQAGGGDPVAWCRSLKGRLPLLHLKDLGVNEERQGVFREIGEGNLNWEQIIATAEQSGCRWFIVEQDGNWLGGDPFASIKVSFDYLKRKIAR